VCYDVKLEQKAPLSGKSLQDHIMGDGRSNYQEYIKALGCIIREQHRNNCKVVQVGPCLYNPDASYTTPVNRFINSSFGFYKTLRPTKQGLVLNVDVCSSDFFSKDLKTETVLDFVADMMDRVLKSKFFKHTGMNHRQR
jgi:hypothetical protein